VKVNARVVFPARAVPVRNQVLDSGHVDFAQSDDFAGHSGFGPSWVPGSDDRVDSLACFVGSWFRSC
jgi:hypothetical protein